METEVQLTRTRIEPSPPHELLRSGASGALAEFTGVVRRVEEGRPIAALEYEAYEPMAVKLMRQILERLNRKHPCHAARVVHRIGVIPVGEAAIWIGVAAAHRREAFLMICEFMDELKRQVPIWKCRALAPEQLSATDPSDT